MVLLTSHYNDALENVKIVSHTVSFLVSVFSRCLLCGSLTASRRGAGRDVHNRNLVCANQFACVELAQVDTSLRAND